MMFDLPIPKFAFEYITMDHGNGGVLSHQLLEAGVFTLFENEFLKERQDGAVLQNVGDVVLATNSYVVNPLHFPGGDIGELAVYGTINNLSMAGGLPEYISLSFIIEEGFSMQEFWNLLVSIKYAAVRAGVRIVTGDTKVVEHGKADKIYINTTAVGKLQAGAQLSARRVVKGDKIILSGELGYHGLAVKSAQLGIPLSDDLISDLRPMHQQTAALLHEFGSDIHWMKDPSRGGLVTALSELATQTHRGINLYGNKIPVNPRVREICEKLGLDPLYVASGGVFIAVVDAGIAHCVVNKLKTMRYGKHTAVIGEVTDAHEGELELFFTSGDYQMLQMHLHDTLLRVN